MRKDFLLLSCCVVIPSICSAQEKPDTTVVEKKAERNVMLNASDANAPRYIQIGLPSEDVNVYENGLPAVYSSYIHPLSAHWRSDGSLSEVGLMNPQESAIATGNIAYSVNSFSDLGGDKFKGIMNYKGNHFGMHQFDFNISGPLGKGWTYALNMYQNFDPGTFDLKFTNYNDRTQIYKGALSKRWANKGQLSFLYKYSNSQRMGSITQFAPFIYHTNGDVTELDGFSLGTSSYVPIDQTFMYRDIKTGEVKTTTINDWNKSKAHEVAVLFKWNLGRAWNLDAKAKYTWADANYADFGGSSIMNVKDGKVEGNTNTYYDKNGNLYTGQMEGRRIWFHGAKAKSFLMTSELLKNFGLHNLKIGINEWNFDINYCSSSTQWDATIQEYPEFLSHSTVADPTARLTYYGFNEISTDYAIGNENKLAAYFTDEWRPIKSLRFFYGARMEWCRMAVDQLPYARFTDMSVGATNADGVTITPQHRVKNKLNYAFTVQATWAFYKGMGLTADFTQMERSPRLTDYANMGPQDLRLRIPLLRGGIYYRNNWIDVTSMVTWIQKTNNTDQQDITKPGTSISKTTSLNYSIQTVGWTTNVELDPFKGFHFHALFTYQKPTYKDYAVTVRFDDGETAELNATGNIVKEIPQILIELDPSYTFYQDKITVWGSFRYFGKTYANLSNALWFNGHWETFAGVKWNATSKLSFNLGVVNFLNQKGASGTISGSELIGTEEAQKFNGYVMSGRYLRPFTVEFGASIKL